MGDNPLNIDDQKVKCLNCREIIPNPKRNEKGEIIQKYCSNNRKCKDEHRNKKKKEDEALVKDIKKSLESRGYEIRKKEERLQD